MGPLHCLVQEERCHGLKSRGRGQRRVCPVVRSGVAFGRAAQVIQILVRPRPAPSKARYRSQQRAFSIAEEIL